MKKEKRKKKTEVNKYKKGEKLTDIPNLTTNSAMYTTAWLSPPFIVIKNIKKKSIKKKPN
jgi:hypothetical protein